MPENTAISFSHDMSFICPDCQKRVEPIDFYDPFKKEERKLPGACPCQEQKREEIKKHQAEVDRRERIMLLREAAQLGRFDGCTFENFQHRPGAETAYFECQKFANEFPQSTGLLLTGQYGNGKSHLAAAMANQLIPQGARCLFRNVPRLLSYIKKTYDTDTHIREWRITEDLRRADLLILDDVGAHKWTEWREETLYAIIDDRYFYKKPLVVTTNCSLDDLEEKIGGRSFDRLVEMCLIVENSASSYRQVIARKRLGKRAGTTEPTQKGGVSNHEAKQASRK